MLISEAKLASKHRKETKRSKLSSLSNATFDDLMGKSVKELVSLMTDMDAPLCKGCAEKKEFAEHLFNFIKAFTGGSKAKQEL